MKNKSYGMENYIPIKANLSVFDEEYINKYAGVIKEFYTSTVVSDKTYNKLWKFLENTACIYYNSVINEFKNENPNKRVKKRSDKNIKSLFTPCMFEDKTTLAAYHKSPNEECIYVDVELCKKYLKQGKLEAVIETVIHEISHVIQSDLNHKNKVLDNYTMAINYFTSTYKKDFENFIKNKMLDYFIIELNEVKRTKSFKNRINQEIIEVNEKYPKKMAELLENRLKQMKKPFEIYNIRDPYYNAVDEKEAYSNGAFVAKDIFNKFHKNLLQQKFNLKKNSNELAERNLNNMKVNVKVFKKIDRNKKDFVKFINFLTVDEFCNFVNTFSTYMNLYKKDTTDAYAEENPSFFINPVNCKKFNEVLDNHANNILESAMYIYKAGLSNDRLADFAKKVTGNKIKK